MGCDLTIVEQRDGSCGQEASQQLEEGIERQLYPGVSAQEAQAEGHSWVQVGPFSGCGWGRDAKKSFEINNNICGL